MSGVNTKLTGCIYSQYLTPPTFLNNCPVNIRNLKAWTITGSRP